METKEENTSFMIRKCLLIIWCLPQSHKCRLWYKHKFRVHLCAQESETICAADNIDVMIFSANCVHENSTVCTKHVIILIPLTYTSSHCLCGVAHGSILSRFPLSLNLSHSRTHSFCHTVVKFEANVLS